MSRSAVQPLPAAYALDDLEAAAHLAEPRFLICLIHDDQPTLTGLMWDSSRPVSCKCSVVLLLLIRRTVSILTVFPLHGIWPTIEDP